MKRHTFTPYSVFHAPSSNEVLRDSCTYCGLPRSAAAHDPEPKPLIDRDEAKKRVAAIVEDISDRRDLKNLWARFDRDVRDEIIESWVQILITGTRR